MTWNFYTLTARRLRLLGYAPKRAICFAGFFFFSLLSFCIAVGLLTGSGKSPGAPGLVSD